MPSYHGRLRPAQAGPATRRVASRGKHAGNGIWTMRRGHLIALCLALNAARAWALDARTVPPTHEPERPRPAENGRQWRGSSDARSEANAAATLPSGSVASLGQLADPVDSPLVAKFRAVLATYDDFAAHGDGKAWTEAPVSSDRLSIRLRGAWRARSRQSTRAGSRDCASPRAPDLAIRALDRVPIAG